VDWRGVGDSGGFGVNESYGWEVVQAARTAKTTRKFEMRKVIFFMRVNT
jgi:hypothetical protein